MNHEPDTIRDKFNCPFVIFHLRSIPCTSFDTVIKKVKYINCWLKSSGMIFFHGARVPSGPGPLPYRGFTITLGTAPLDQ